MNKVGRLFAAIALAFASLVWSTHANAETIQFTYYWTAHEFMLTDQKVDIVVTNNITNTIGGGVTADSYRISIDGAVVVETSEIHDAITYSFEVVGTKTIKLEGIDNGYWAGYHGPIMDITWSSLAPPPWWQIEFWENQTVMIGAQDGYVFDTPNAWYGDPNSACGVDVSSTVGEIIEGQTTASFVANNELFTDPCPGVVKVLRLSTPVVPAPVDIASESPTVSQSPDSSPTESDVTESPVSESPTVSPESSSESPQTESPSAIPPTDPEPQPTPVPLPEPTPQPEPIPQPQPEPEPSPEPTPTPSPEPSPEPTVEPTPYPEPIPTVEPESQPTPEPELTLLPKPEETLNPTPSLTPKPEEPSPILTQKPEPSPEPKPGVGQEIDKPNLEEVTPSTPISDVISAIENISPTSLTQEQVSVLVEVAMQAFETAEPGSEEYDQALDLLLVAAQADDVVLDEELAAIPLIGNVAGVAVEVFNALGNAGADMSPQVREQSEKVVVASVIVANIAITATSAATSAAAVAARRP